MLYEVVSNVNCFYIRRFQMNARSIKKILMRNRDDIGWGSRAYLIVRFALETFPELYPRFSPEQLREIGTADIIEGAWERSDPKEKVDIWTTISRMYSSDLPEEDPTRTICYVEKDIINDKLMGYSWYEGLQRLFNFGTLKDEYDFTTLDKNFIEQRTLDKKIIDVYVAQQQWKGKYIFAARNSPYRITRLIAETLSYCKTAYFTDDQNSYLLEFAVKWFYPEEKYGFCSKCAKLISELKRISPKARVLKRSA